MTLFTGLSAFPLTPRDAAGRVMTQTLHAMLDRVMAARPDSIGLLGSTGGYAYLAAEERKRVLRLALERVAGRVPVVVGVGALTTDEAVDLARDARAAGADGLLLAPMSYHPLTDDEVFAHVSAVAVAGGLPLCLYNNPGTTKFTFSPALIARLSKVAHVAAVKMPLPADGDFAGELARLRGMVPPGFAVGYSGDWGAKDALLAGADGWFSVVAGLLPGAAVALTRAARAGDTAEAARFDAAFGPLWTLFRELGSFRVMFEIADVLGLGQPVPPRPILPLGPDLRPLIAQAVAAVRDIG